jgi:putative NADH-flavin reductase
VSKTVVVLGAAGRTGRLIVEEALRAGHRVTAAVRAPEKFTIAGPEPRVAQAPEKLADPRVRETPEKVAVTSPGPRVARADVRDPDSLREAIRGTDAVVSAIGPAGRKSLNLYSDGARAIVTAMRQTGAGRLLAITSVGVRHDDPHFSWWYRSLIRPLGADLYADMGRLEETVRATELDWTFVRPTYLQDREPTGVYRTVDNCTPQNGWRITRGDVARFIVAELDLHRWSRRAPSLAE